MKRDKRQDTGERAVFFLLLAVMAVYYGYRMSALTPWYDELYTYYCFISKGPVYAAIHWPLPNNHVGYSVLSGFLDYLGDPYIGLRGVSYVCALVNMCLLYKISKRYLDAWVPLAVVLLYISMDLVNQLAVQGRGYTLGITCFLTAWLCMAVICEQRAFPRKVYVIYAIALVLGLYAVSSNVYWVVPLCLSGGIYLLIRGVQEVKKEEGERKKLPLSFLKTESGHKLAKLVAASLAAALGTVFLYTIIWAAIGSNLLVKDKASAFYGLSHIKMLLRSPFAAIERGMGYMLATPYIQSEERAGFGGRLFDWLISLSGHYYRWAAVVVAVWLIGIFFLVFKIRRSIAAGRKMRWSWGEEQTAPGYHQPIQAFGAFPREGHPDRLLLYLILLIEIVFVPLCLLIQCKRPYYRVFTYGGVLLAVLLGVLISWILKGISAIGKAKWRAGHLSTIAFLLAVAISVKCLGSFGYNQQYGTREHEIEDAFSKADIGKWDNFCVTDCYQEYLLYFLYGIRCENREIEGADVVLLDKRMADPEFDEMIWEFYHYHDTIPWGYIEQEMELVYENEDYLLYTRTTDDD